MRIIPKQTKVKNTVWKCYSMPDIIVALVLFALIFICMTCSSFAWAVVFALVAVVLLMPTQDGIMYTILLENCRFLFSKKRYVRGALYKESVEMLTGLKDIREDGCIVYAGGWYGKAMRIGQKNFGIEDGYRQDMDINCLSRAFKMLDLSQCCEIVKTEVPANLDRFSEKLFETLSAVEDSTGYSVSKSVGNSSGSKVGSSGCSLRGCTEGNTDGRYRATGSRGSAKNSAKSGASSRSAASAAPPDPVETRCRILSGRIDRIDRMNNVKRQYMSSFCIVVYGRDKKDLLATCISMAEEIKKAGLACEMLGMRDAAVFLKYSSGCRPDEREAKNMERKKLAAWTEPKEVTFTSGSFTQDGVEAVTAAVADYPLHVRNAWGSGIFNIPGTKAVMHLKPVERTKAIRRIDKCVSDMETKTLTTEKASEATSAETHKATMLALLDSLQKDNETLFDVSLTVTAYNYGAVPDFKKRIRKALMSRDFRPSMLYGMQTEGYKSSCPSPVSTLSRYERGIDSGTAAAVFPFVRTSVMDEDGVLLGRTKSGAPFIFNIWKRGSLYQNSNAMIIGKSGSGKSYFMKTFIANEWSNGTRVIVLDPENEYTTLAHNLGGTIIDVGNATEGRINPFHIYSILSEDGSPASPEITFNTHLKTLEGFFRIVLEGAPSDVIEQINSLVIDAYARRDIYKETDCTGFCPEAFPTFTDLVDALHDRMAQASDPLTQKDLRTAQLYLEKFVSGRYSDIWNGPSTMTSHSAAFAPARERSMEDSAYADTDADDSTDMGEYRDSIYADGAYNAGYEEGIAGDAGDADSEAYAGDAGYADMSVFNFQSLFANKNNVVANAQMLLVFRYIEQEIINARERGRLHEQQRTMIIVDEAHLFIDPKFPLPCFLL